MIRFVKHMWSKDENVITNLITLFFSILVILYYISLSIILKIKGK